MPYVDPGGLDNSQQLCRYHEGHKTGREVSRRSNCGTLFAALAAQRPPSQQSILLDSETPTNTATQVSRHETNGFAHNHSHPDHRPRDLTWDRHVRDDSTFRPPKRSFDASVEKDRENLGKRPRLSLPQDRSRDSYNRGPPLDKRRESYHGAQSADKGPHRDAGERGRRSSYRPTQRRRTRSPSASRSSYTRSGSRAPEARGGGEEAADEAPQGC
ncbi:hypothetical protein B0T21DRAFT_410546 [Apiosordaria backusii]|uniref:Uncharacterized protein n=1 Tax=Apiosordaria backusii TaxID=314023 RepID=A0AA40BMR5_9PEZI|nr:hypothetical protein B0T21DRAFT_410546 [Apiosordaria backusii]